MAITAPAPLTDEELAARTPEEELAIFGQDETDSTLITFRGSVEIERTNRDRPSVHARTIRFKVVHHVDRQYDYVDVLVDSPDRPRDALDWRVDPNCPGGTVASTLDTLVAYIKEQEGRIEKEAARVV